MKKCARCGLPETFETIEFGEDGVCNLCKASDTRKETATNIRGLGALIEQYRGKHAYDCLIPFSGGKDSTYTLWHLVAKYDLKPLVVMCDHGFMRPNLLANNERTFKKLGVDVHRFTPNWKLVKRTMLEALIRKGDFCWHCHSLIFAYPMQVALKEQVPLIFWGEPSSQYTAYYKPGQVEEVDEERFDKFVNLGLSADDMGGIIKKDFEFDFRDMKPFTYPDAADLRKLGVRSVCLGSYIPWNPREQSKIIEKELGWKPDQVEGMPSIYNYEKIECGVQGVRDYIKWLKRGYGRVTQMTALDRRNGLMDGASAEQLIAECEGKKPASLELFLEYIGITEGEFNDYVKATVVPPHTPDFSRPSGYRNYDFDQMYREPKC